MRANEDGGDAAASGATRIWGAVGRVVPALDPDRHRHHHRYRPSTRPVTALSCFDYGNAETNNRDDGAATMEAVYWGNSRDWGHGAGAGPWVSGASAGHAVDYGGAPLPPPFKTASLPIIAPRWRCGPPLVHATVPLPVSHTHRARAPRAALHTTHQVMADLENGLFAGNETGNDNNTPITTDFVFAMVKGGTNGFALKASDATTGTLKVMFDGPRPRGYPPMKKQGAIILVRAGRGGVCIGAREG